MTLKELLDDWTEADYALYYLACCLGLMEYREKGKKINIFQFNNPIVTMCYEIFKLMIEKGILEENDYAQFRWNKSFKGFWEMNID